MKLSLRENGRNKIKRLRRKCLLKINVLGETGERHGQSPFRRIFDLNGQKKTLSEIYILGNMG
jgi:hypothetical protein